MKTLKYILSASISLVFLTACNDSFLEKYPETELKKPSSKLRKTWQST